MPMPPLITYMSNVVSVYILSFIFEVYKWTSKQRNYMNNSAVIKNITNKIDNGGYVIKRNLSCYYGNGSNIGIWQ